MAMSKSGKEERPLPISVIIACLMERKQKKAAKRMIWFERVCHLP